jgi:phage shock protein E
MTALRVFKSYCDKVAPAEWEELLAEEPVIVDVRSADEFADGHLSGAQNIPLDQLANQVLNIKKWTKPVIVCCTSGLRSARAKAFLHAQGLEEVYDLGNWHNLSFRLSFS